MAIKNWTKPNIAALSCLAGMMFSLFICIATLMVCMVDPPPPEHKPCVQDIKTSDYLRITRAYDNLNQSLRECEEFMNLNDYLIQQMNVVRKFMPDSTEGEMHQLCEDCSANCEEALNWCYYYREEACFCVDDWEE